MPYNALEYNTVSESLLHIRNLIDRSFAVNARYLGFLGEDYQPPQLFNEYEYRDACFDKIIAVANSLGANCDDFEIDGNTMKNILIVGQDNIDTFRAYLESTHSIESWESNLLVDADITPADDLETNQSVCTFSVTCRETQPADSEPFDSPIMSEKKLDESNKVILDTELYKFKDASDAEYFIGSIKEAIESHAVFDWATKIDREKGVNSKFLLKNAITAVEKLVKAMAGVE